MAGIPFIHAYPMPKPGHLPANKATWAIDPDRAVLLVHDMQRYFLKPFAAPLRDELISNVASLCQRSRSNGMPVAFSAQPGGMTTEQRGLLIDFWGPGMKVDPEDRKVVDELEPSDSDWMSPKWRYSAFFQSGLLERMRAAGRDQLVICGVYAHIGVLSTAIESFTNDIQTFLVADAVADFSEQEHQLALTYASQRCAVLCSTQETLA
ncbi:isochorismatase family protein [Pseudomonas sp. TCU-HL1]|uniref:isochorismatase family protein n=1 Tax=Pseudomonas sp. TCU-HL1 TaxID=1856685 RepID=UPI00083DC32D|nr:isochorismatase family protein [Pseudomonas sp. TCU-HL1]AOE86169.1 isochorismatase [Pseudomonas sp. TCU-HL1]